MAYIECIKTNEGTTYRVQIRIKGYNPESRSFKYRRAAKDWAYRREIEIKEGQQSIEEKAKKYKVKEIIQRYISTTLQTKTAKKRSRQIQEKQLLWWKDEIGETSLINCTRSLITEKRDMLAQDLKPGTVNRYLAALSHVFTIAYKEWEVVRENPVKKVSMMREPRLRVRFLTDAQRKEMLIEARKINFLLYLYIILALSTGARKNEILTLKWVDVNFEKHKAILHETKNNRRRSIFFYSAAYDAMKERYKDRRKGFKNVFAKRRCDEPIDIYPMWYKLIKRLGLKDFRLHDLRHTFATESARNGASIKDLAEMLGHNSLSMVQRYAHEVESHTSELVRKMNEKINE